MNSTLSTGHNLQHRLKGALLGVVGSFVLFATYLAIPPLGIFSGILAPYPAAYNRLMHGRLAALIVILGSATALTALFGIFAGSLYLAMCALIGVVMPELVARGFSASRALFWTTLLNVLLFVIGFVAYSAVSGVDLAGMISAEISSSMKQAVSIYEKAGVKGEDLDLLKRTIASGAEMLAKLYPAMVTVLLITIAGINLALLKKSFAKTATPLPIGEFSSYRTPDLLVWLLIASGFALVLPESAVTTPALNLLMVVSLLYFLQGLAVISTIATRNSVSTLIRVMMYAMLIIQPYLLALIAGIGLFDLWADFRTPKPQENL